MREHFCLSCLFCESSMENLKITLGKCSLQVFVPRTFKSHLKPNEWCHSCNCATFGSIIGVTRYNSMSDTISHNRQESVRFLLRTVSCPLCHEQCPVESRFCSKCGYFLMTLQGRESALMRGSSLASFMSGDDSISQTFSAHPGETKEFLKLLAMPERMFDMRMNKFLSVWSCYLLHDLLSSLAN